MNQRTPNIGWDSIRANITRSFGEPAKLWSKQGGLHDESWEWSWIPEVEGVFSDADFVTARMAMSGAAAPTEPWLIRYFPAGYDAAKEDEVHWAASRVDALAYVFEGCRGTAVFPDAVQVDENSGAISLELAGEPFAAVSPIRLMPAHRHEKKAVGTLLGCRRHSDPSAELHKRLSRWPGMERLEQEKWGDGDAGEFPHVPDVGEWLVGAGHMLAQGGLPSGMAEKQKLVAALFEAPSFNHVVAGRSEELAGLAGPWAVSEHTADGEIVWMECHANPFGALASMMNAAANRTAHWPALALHVSRSWQVGSLGLRLWGASSIQVDAPYFKMEQMRPASPDDSGSADGVATALQDQTGRLLGDLFMEGNTGTERVSELLADRGYELIGQSGRTHFVLKRDPNDARFGTLLGCFRFNESGNLDKDAFVRCYKGTVAYDTNVNYWVMYSEDRYRKPVMVVRDIPAALLSKLRDLLPEMKREYRGNTLEEERKTVERLVAKVGV